MIKFWYFICFYVKRFRHFFLRIIYEEMTKKTNNKMLKNANKYCCEQCNFICSKESNWNIHLTTTKHKIRTNTNVALIENATKYECICGKTYKHASSLWNHKQVCDNDKNNINDKNNTIDNKPNEFQLDKELLIKMLLKNQDVMEKLAEVMPMMMEIMPKLGNNSHNTTNNNTTNNQFNIQLFLNEHCKNAMNLTDFIDSLPITASTYDSTIENGLTKTITNMITNGLNKLDILERPIHCTDATRKTLYVKEADIWEKDTELLKVVDGIKTLIRKKRTLISRWKEANIGWDTVESKQMRFTELICNIMTDVDFDEKETGKIVRSISKSVYLDSEDKKKYLC